MPAKEKESVAANKPSDSKSKAKGKATPKSPNQKPRAKSTRKTKSFVLVKPIEGIFTSGDGEQAGATFFAEDVGLTYEDNDPDVARAVELYPDHFSES